MISWPDKLCELRAVELSAFSIRFGYIELSESKGISTVDVVRFSRTCFVSECFIYFGWWTAVMHRFCDNEIDSLLLAISARLCFRNMEERVVGYTLLPVTYVVA